jgi:hypothetical protein
MLGMASTPGCGSIIDPHHPEKRPSKDQGKSPKKIADRQRKLDQAHADLEDALINAGK